MESVLTSEASRTLAGFDGVGVRCLVYQSLDIGFRDVSVRTRAATRIGFGATTHNAMRRLAYSSHRFRILAYRPTRRPVPHVDLDHKTRCSLVGQLPHRLITVVAVSGPGSLQSRIIRYAFLVQEDWTPRIEASLVPIVVGVLVG